MIRRDQQKTQFGHDVTYAPVVEWSTVRLLLVPSLHHNLQTASIDFKNAFVQPKVETLPDYIIGSLKN